MKLYWIWSVTFLCYLRLHWLNCFLTNNLFSAVANRDGAEQKDTHLHQVSFSFKA